MTPDDQLRLISFLEARVRLAVPAGRQIAFELPSRAELVEAGIPEEGALRLLEAPWAAEMAAEVRETPGFCAEDEEPAQVLRYARDVVGEYLRKRLPLESQE